jgi:hypothetical protein
MNRYPSWRNATINDLKQFGFKKRWRAIVLGLKPIRTSR